MRAQILSDCRPEDDGVHHAMPGTAPLHNLTLTGRETTTPVTGMP
ncbi:hypothetical protein [Streptomyces sp. enrichment culture]